MRNFRVIQEIRSSVFNGIKGTNPGVTYLFLMKAFPIEKITTKGQNETALAVMERLITYVNSREKELDLNTRMDIGRYTTLLGDQIEEFEKNHYPNIGKNVSGTEMLEYFMDLHHLKQKDIAKELGGQSVVSNILNGKSQLNTKQIATLAKRFKVSPAVFFDC